MRPQTHYARCGDLSIAYQVTGDGPLDLIYVPGWISHLEYAWEYPNYARVFERLSSFSRFIRFDKRGTGLSDREVGFPTLEQRTDDVRAVMDAVGSERAALLGISEGGNLCVLFAATYPDRTEALVLYGCYARGLWAEDYPWGRTREEIDDEIARIARNWGGPFDLSDAAPSLVHDERTRDWCAAYWRYSASPKAAKSIWEWNMELDVRGILPTIHVPTLVLHRHGDRWVRFEEGTYLAEHIPGAKFVELSGEDHMIWAGDQEPILEETEEFLTGVRRGPDSERVLLTVLFTDIVGSTSKAAQLGDRRWKELLQQHDEALRRHLVLYEGNEVKTTGDGLLATFDGPTRAIRCAVEMRKQLATLGLEIRASLHTGECERRGKDLSGIAVHLASRILGEAGEGEIVVSGTVKELVIGSGLEFDERGVRTLKDVPGEWKLFSVASS